MEPALGRDVADPSTGRRLRLFAEVLTTLADPIRKANGQNARFRALRRFREIKQYCGSVLRFRGAIGVLTGLMPGVGEDAGARMSYAAAKAVSKEKEQFGKERSTA